jgi:hypothetical protein
MPHEGCEERVRRNAKDENEGQQNPALERPGGEDADTTERDQWEEDENGDSGSEDRSKPADDDVEEDFFNELPRIIHECEHDDRVAPGDRGKSGHKAPLGSTRFLPPLLVLFKLLAGA